MKIADLIEAARRLRLAKRPMRFRPRLIYLVESHSSYVHPSRIGYTSGQTAWADSSLWFQCHKDAKEYADTLPDAKVVKLNICAFAEPVIRSAPQ